MGVALGGQLYLSFKVDGTEVPLGTSSLLNVFINQSCRQLVPVIKTAIPDMYGAFDKLVPINDGSMIHVEMNDDRQPAFNGSSGFRAFGTPQRQPMAQFTQYNIMGLLDAIPYVRGNPPGTIQGSSVDVMKNVAQAMNFNYTGKISTNDVMRWLPGRHTWGTFTKRAALHGWVGENSALVTAVDEQRQLHYIDVNDQFANAPVKAHIIYGGSTAISGNVPTYAATEYKAVNRSGMLNNWHGYGSRITQHSVLDGVVNKFKTIQAMKVNNLIDMSKDVLGQLAGRARIDIPPIATGNTHDNYIQARHHNTRMLSLYSQNIYVLVPATTGLNVFDMVEFESGAENSSENSVNGLYSVTNMTRALINSRYMEKIELTNSGPANANPSLV